MSDAFEYDVFLSHSVHDLNFARVLAQRIKSDGLRVCFEESEARAGEEIGEKARGALERSRALILVISSHAFGEEWEWLERQTALFRDAHHSERRFIPLLLEKIEVKDVLKPFVPIDLSERSEEQWAKLLKACQHSESPPEPVDRPQARQVLEGHTQTLHGVAVTADGRVAVTASSDTTVRVWDLEAGRCAATLEGHSADVNGAATTADGRLAVTGSSDRTVRVWDLEAGRCAAVLEGHADKVFGVAVTADGRRAVSGSGDGTVRVWDLEADRCTMLLEGHSADVWSVAVTADGRLAVTGSSDRTVRVWDLEAGRCAAVLEGHADKVFGVAVTADGRRAVSGSGDGTVRVWDVQEGRCVAVLEGHFADVWYLAVTADGRRALSGSLDGTVRVWDLEARRCAAILEGGGSWVLGVAVTADGRRAVSGYFDPPYPVRVWDLPPVTVRPGSGHYTNAKVVIVGDSSVGKTGLALRLSEDRFEASFSTDGVWATQMELSDEGAPSGTEREIWLWDFAGQADYRLIHQLFLDETALAVLVFNPQSENPLDGLLRWNHDLRRAAPLKPGKLLVAARCDRGRLMVSGSSIERFRREWGFAEYLETSALTGANCQELRAAVIRNIPWKNLPWTASPRIYKQLKEAILKLRDEGVVLLRTAELRQQIEMRLPGESFTPDELKAVMRLLAGAGLVWRLGFGDFMLLQPERLNAYAAAVVRKVRASLDEIGCIPEDDVIAGRLDFQEMKRLPASDEQIVLRAIHQTFLERGLCLREPTDEGALLIFPSYFRGERPQLEGCPPPFVSYQFSGAVDETYATLVVRLYYTKAFEKNRLWRFAVDFKTSEGKRMGLRMIRKGEDSAEIAVHFEPGVSNDAKVTFIRYIHDHVKSKDHNVVRVRHYACPRCGEPVESPRAVKMAVERGRKNMPCQFCSAKVPLFDLIERKFASEELQQRVRTLEEKAKTNIENESLGSVLVGHAFAVAEEAGQIFRETQKSENGLDGEIEFKDYRGYASGQRVYLQLRAGQSYSHERRSDGSEVFKIKNRRHATYWKKLSHPVMLVVRGADGVIRWMDVTAALRRRGKSGKSPVKQIVFTGEPFTALNLQLLRDRLVAAGNPFFSFDLAPGFERMKSPNWSDSRGGTTKMADWPPKLFQEVVSLLQPYMEEKRREALLAQALHGCRVLDSIEFAGDRTTFTTNLVRRLKDFGEYEPGKPSVVALLETVRESVGLDVQAKFDAAIGKVPRGNVPATTAGAIETAPGGRSPTTTVLALSSNPYGSKPLKLQEEMDLIRERLAHENQGGSFRFEFESHVPSGALQETLLRHRPAVVHFSGHGTQAGDYLFEDKAGNSVPISPEVLGRVFSTLKGQVRCVVLNACFAESQARAIAEYIPFVVGMSRALPDRSALAFSSGFYLGVAAGKEFDEAFDLGRNQILMEALPGEEIPRLCRNDNGRVYVYP